MANPVQEMGHVDQMGKLFKPQSLGNLSKESSSTVEFFYYGYH
jgi:hypothetical protein